MLTAFRATEYSFEGEPRQATDGSLFTGAIVDGIRNGAADGNGDGSTSRGTPVSEEITRPYRGGWSSATTSAGRATSAAAR